MFARFLSVLALVLACAAASAPGAAPGRTGSAARAVSGRPLVVFDAIGDAAGVVGDITSVAAARDAQNRVTFAINVAGHPAMKHGEVFVIGIDADRALSTGSEGRDIVLMLGWPAGEPRPTYFVGTWGGRDWRPLDIAVDAWHSSSGPRFAVAMGKLGIGRSFRFDARAARMAAPRRDAVDKVPAKGLASAVFRNPASISEIGRMMVPFTGLLPKAGKVLRVKGIEIEAADGRVDVVPGISVGSVVKPDRVRCTAEIGRTVLRPIGACAWRVPSTARGKTLVLKLSVAYGGDEVTELYPLSVE
jgi:hypothetical protein